MTPKNRIAEIRRSRGLTQQALAELAGTSQQQVQRIEAGLQGVRLELATKIAKGLKLELAEVFPSLASSRRPKSLAQSRYVNPRARFDEAGLDPDPNFWTAKFFSFDGREFLYGIPSHEKERLEKIFSRHGDGIVVFATTAHWVAVNRGKTAAIQFLFDRNVQDGEDEDEKMELKLHLVNAQRAIVFGIHPDTKTLDEADYDTSAQMQRLFYELEMQLDDQIVAFDDEDNERVYLRSAEIMVVEVPIECCEPALWNSQIEGEAEEDAAKNASLHTARTSK